jgi:carbonic anhydrase/acetyltransferase-like protein (isoleucine patch superfamily)
LCVCIYICIYVKDSTDRRLQTSTTRSRTCSLIVSHTHNLEPFSTIVFVSIWYSAIVRGDVNAITIGTSSSIGDRAVIHVAKIQGDLPTTIGDHVTICAGAIVHAATIHNAVVIGESAQVMDGAVVETQSIVAPGAVVAPGTIVNSGELWAGNPARKVRDLTDDETVGIVAQAVDTAKLAEEHAIENSKDYEEIMEDLMILELESAMDPTAPRPADYDSNAVLGQGHPGRIFRSTLSHPYDGKRTPDGSPYAE